MHHTQVAWALAETVEDNLTRAERFDAFLGLGSGDHDVAVRILLRAAVRERIALPRDLIAGLRIWVDANLGADDDGRALLALVAATEEPAAQIAVTPPRYLPVSNAYQRPQAPTDDV